jgi:hypothetical protein
MHQLGDILPAPLNPDLGPLFLEVKAVFGRVVEMGVDVIEISLLVTMHEERGKQGVPGGIVQVFGCRHGRRVDWFLSDWRMP